MPAPRVVLVKAIGQAVDLTTTHVRADEPTRAQAKAGNYAKRSIDWKGLTIRIENEAGSVRRGTKPDGSPWETRMAFPYGEIARTEGVDGDPVDVFIGPFAETAEQVFVIHQRRVDDWERYDEDKCMIGWLTEAEAREAFLQCYDDPRFLGPITAMPVAEFVEKAKATRKAPRMIKAVQMITRRDGVAQRYHVADPEPEQPAEQSLADDMDAQMAWLDAQATDMGYAGLEDLVARNFPAFEQLAAKWREDHPVDVALKSFSDEMLKARVGPYIRQGKLVNLHGYDGRHARGQAAAGQTSLFSEEDAPAPKPKKAEPARFDHTNTPDLFDEPAAPVRQTETRAFKEWFGSSKVRDENGEPMRMYHITPHDFDTFHPGGKEVLDGHAEGQSGRAIWFSPFNDHQPAAHNTHPGMKARREGVKYRDGTNVMPVYLRIERPLMIDDKTMLEWARNAFAGGSSEFPQIVLSKWKDEITKEGYDGIIFRGDALGWGEKDVEYIAFDPHQIKSAIGNNGDFSKDSPVITKSLPILFLKAKHRGDDRTADMFGTHVEARTRKDGHVQNYHVANAKPAAVVKVTQSKKVEDAPNLVNNDSVDKEVVMNQEDRFTYNGWTYFRPGAAVNQSSYPGQPAKVVEVKEAKNGEDTLYRLEIDVRGHPEGVDENGDQVDKKYATVRADELNRLNPSADPKDAAIAHLKEDAKQADLPAAEKKEDAALVAKLEDARGEEDDHHAIAHMARNLSGKASKLGDLVAPLKQTSDKDWQYQQSMSKPEFDRAYRQHYTDARIVHEKLRELDQKYPKLKIMEKIAGPEAMRLISSYAQHRYYEPDEQSLKNMIEDSKPHLKAAKPAKAAPQQAEDLEKFIKVAADSIGQLRKIDVLRVLESNSSRMVQLANYITDKRPDLAKEVAECMDDIGIKDWRAAPTKSSPQADYKAAVSSNKTGPEDNNPRRKFYVTIAREGRGVAMLAGPFDTHDEAKAHVERAKEKAIEVDPRAAFDAFGTSGVESDNHKPGVLNDQLGLGTLQPAPYGDDHPAPTPRIMLNDIPEQHQERWKGLHREQHEIRYWHLPKLRKEMDRHQGVINRALEEHNEQKRAAEDQLMAYDRERQKAHRESADKAFKRYQSALAKKEAAVAEHQKLHARMTALGKEKDKILPKSGDLDFAWASQRYRDTKERQDMEQANFRTYSDHFKPKAAPMVKAIRQIT